MKFIPQQQQEKDSAAAQVSSHSPDASSDAQRSEQDVMMRPDRKQRDLIYDYINYFQTDSNVSIQSFCQWHKHSDVCRFTSHPDLQLTFISGGGRAGGHSRTGPLEPMWCMKPSEHPVVFLTFPFTTTINRDNINIGSEKLYNSIGSICKCSVSGSG